MNIDTNILAGSAFLLVALLLLAFMAWRRDVRKAHERGFETGYGQAEREAKDKARKQLETHRRDALFGLSTSYFADLQKMMPLPPQWWVMQRIATRGQAPTTEILETGIGTNQLQKMPKGQEGPFVVGVWPIRTDGNFKDIKGAIRVVSAMRADGEVPPWMENSDLDRLWNLFPAHLRRAVATEDASPETMLGGALDVDAMVTYLRSLNRYLVLKRGESVRPMIMLLEEAGYTVTPPPPRTTGETSVQVSAALRPGEQAANDDET